MNDDKMRQTIEQVLANMNVEALEERIAPVKCDKQPEHPDCQPVVRYGVIPDDDPVVRYGIGM